MKFLLDENFPRSALIQLRNAGHLATHVLELFPPGITDELLFAHAQQERAIFVTTDRDFFHTIPLAFAQHNGAIVITLRRPNRQDLLRRLAEALSVLGDRNLISTVWLVTDTRIYSRQKANNQLD